METTGPPLCPTSPQPCSAQPPVLPQHTLPMNSRDKHTFLGCSFPVKKLVRPCCSQGLCSANKLRYVLPQVSLPRFLPQQTQTHSEPSPIRALWFSAGVQTAAPPKLTWESSQSCPCSAQLAEDLSPFPGKLCPSSAVPQPLRLSCTRSPSLAASHIWDIPARRECALGLTRRRISLQPPMAPWQADLDLQSPKTCSLP